MQIATWNVNSLKVRLPQVLDWLDTHPDVSVLALQETKQEDSNFPQAEIEAAGFHIAFAGQKTYNGVAVIARTPISDPVINIPGFIDEQKRLLAVTVAGIRLVCVYIPNGQALDSEKYSYKLSWLAALNRWLETELQRHPNLALLGDFNIAPEDRDVHNPALREGQILVSPAERSAWSALLRLGLHDAFRLFPQEEKLFSWWDYRNFSFRKNAGLRIDHILLSTPLTAHCTACDIDKNPRKLERPSDHTPVIATLTL